MAFTKVLGPGIHTLSNITSHNIHSSGIITATGFDGPFTNLNVTGVTTFSGDVSIGGTLTYEDVKNIDSIGIVTAREGIDLPTDKKILLGDNDKFTIYKSSSPAHAIIENAYSAGSYLRIGSANGVIIGSPISHNQSMIRGYVNGRAELYYAGSEKIRTTDKGIQVGTGVTIETNGQANFVGVTTFGNVVGGATTSVVVNRDLILRDSWGYGNHIKFHWGTNTLNFPSASLQNIARVPNLSFGDRTNNGNQVGIGDFLMYHDYYNMHMRYWGANGNLIFSNKNTEIHIQGSNGSGNPQQSIRIKSGATEGVILHHGGNAKFETAGIGASVYGTLEATGGLTVAGVSTFSSDVSIQCTGDANLNLIADTGNNNESSVPTINFTQDGGVNVFKVGVEGTAGETFTGSTDNTPYLMTTTGHGGTNLDFAVGGGLRMKLTATGLQPATNNVQYLGTNTMRWARLYTNGIYDGNVKRFGVTSSGFEGYGTEFKFSDTGDCNVIINADTDNSDESHTPNLSFRQDGAVTVLQVGVEGNAGDQFTGSTGNYAYVQVGGHSNVGLEIATGNSSTKRLTIDTNGHIIPAADGTYNIGSSSVRFANVYADNLHGNLDTSLITSAVTIDVNGNDNGETTLFTLDNYVSDLSNEYTWIDFTFRDSNSNSTPQVKIGAQVGDDSGTGQQGEGAGDFVVKCAVDTASNTMTEMFRCSHDTKITSVHHHPQSHESFDLGTETSRWRQVYATDFRAPDGNTNGLYAGNSYDLHLFHNGSHSFIENDTGNLTFTNKNNDNIIFKTTSSETERIRITSGGDFYAGNADTGGYAFFDNSTLRPRYQFRQGTGTNRGFAIIETRGDANGMDVFIAKSREGNGTGLINAGDNLGKINFAGADGTNMVNGAQIFAYTQSTKTVAADRMPTNLSFRTHDDNTSGLIERMRMWHDGRIGISKNGWASTDNSFALTVHTGSTSDSGAAVNDGIMIVSQNSNGNQNSSTGKLMFCGHAQTNGPFIYGKNAQAYGKKDLVFHTRSTANDYTTQVAETFRITYNGYVGINEPAPDSQLVVRATSDDNPAIKLYRQSGGGDTASIAWASSAGTNAQINYRGGAGSEGLQFRTSTGNGNTGSMKERFRVNHGNTQGVQVFVMTESDNSPIDDVTAITIQNGTGGGDIGSTSESTHIDWKWVDSNSNVTPQCRISGHVGDGGDPNSHAKEGKGFLTFHCSNTGNTSGVEDPPEAMRLNHLGDLCLNQITNDTRLGIKAHSYNTSKEFFTCRDTSSNLKFYIHHSGATYNSGGSYGNISDVSLKENIVDANSQWNDIKNIKIRNFNFKESTGQETYTQIGVIAQEVETVSPKLVSTPKEGIKTVKSSILYMKAVKALQEAMARIETLEAEVAALKGS